MRLLSSSQNILLLIILSFSNYIPQKSFLLLFITTALIPIYHRTFNVSPTDPNRPQQTPTAPPPPRPMSIIDPMDPGPDLLLLTTVKSEAIQAEGMIM